MNALFAAYAEPWKIGVNDQWGGKPYEDLLKLIDYLETLPYLDQSKAILAGASYGGYLVAWLMGHDIINKVYRILYNYLLYYSHI